MIKDSPSRKVFNLVNVLFLSLLGVVCVLPFMHLLALSFSSAVESSAGTVGFIPKGLSIEAYKFLLQKVEFFKSLGVTVIRVILGLTIGMTVVILAAYPLSKEATRFKKRTLYVWFFAITMFIGGGLIPTYMVIRQLKITNTIWALVLPGACSVWNIVMLLNFFRQIPRGLEEAAIIDGASQFQVLRKVFLPISKPSLATLSLFTMVGHWNSWFDGMLYINNPAKYPLQTYLSTIVIGRSSNQVMTQEQLELLKNVSEQNLIAAQIFLGALPIMLVYPFLQKYFVKGLTIGSVKG